MKTHITLLLVALMAISCLRKSNEVSSDKSNAMLERVSELNTGGHKQAALSLADSALMLNPADSTKCRILTEKTVALIDMGRMEESMTVAQEAYQLAYQLSDTEVMLNLHGAMGIAYRRMGKTDSALVQYEKGIEIALQEKNLEYEIYLNNCITVLYASSKRYDEAIEYAQKAEKAALAMKDTIEYLSARANIGSIYMNENKPQEALDAILPYWQGVKEVNYNILSLKYLSIILKAYSVMNDYDAVDKYMTYADSIMEGMSVNSNGVLGILEIKIGLLGQQGKYSEQLALLDSMIACSDVNLPMPKETLLWTRAICLEKIGKKDDALNTIKMAYHLLDSVKNSDIENSMSEFSVKYKTMETEMALTESQRETAEKANQVMGLVIVIIGLVGIVCLMLYYKRIAAQKALIKEKQSYIDGLESERERIAKELHDGVCNDILAAKLLMATDRPQADNYLHDVWQNVRQLSHVLMPPNFKNVALDTVTRSYISSVEKNGKHNISLYIDTSFEWNRLPQQVAYETYRIIQEATGNALKYGNNIDISLQVKNGIMYVKVSNDVIYRNDEEQNNTSFSIGQQTLRKRVDRIGAKLTTAADNMQYTLTMTYNISSISRYS